MDESAHVKVLSRKRKNASPSSSTSNRLTEVLTRSKSRMYWHRNRSGKFRSDPVPRKPFFEIEMEKAFPDVSRIDASGCSFIKDLRMRRVFTPDVCSVPVKEVKNEEGKEVLMISSDSGPDSSPLLDLRVGDEKGVKLDESRIIQVEAHDGRNDAENGLGLRDCLVNNSISESKMALDKSGRRKVFKTPSSFSYRRLLPYLMDIMNDDETSVPNIEIVDARIPHKSQELDGAVSNIPHDNSDYASPSENGDIKKLHEKAIENLKGAENEFGKAEEVVRPVKMEQNCNENGVNRIDATVEEECCQMTPPELDVVTKTKFGGCGDSTKANNMQVEKQAFKGLLIGSEKSSKPGTKSNRSVLNPCSQLRLFKNPGSVNYRRLLPFLMDISKNNTSASRIIQSPVAAVDLKEELHPVSYASDAAGKNDVQNMEKEIGMQNSPPSMIPPQPSDDLLPGSNARPSSSMPNISTNASLSSETPIKLCGSNDFKMGETPKSLITPRNLEPDFDRENSLALPQSSTENDDILNKEFTPEEPVTVGKKMMHLCAELEVQNNDKDSVCKINLNLGQFQSEMADGLVASVNGPSKGILKRNRQGCRGLCNCLTCSSFRLHAGRAFEFSRNQMHDADEVASELMKELANLRNMLEKSVTNDNVLIASQLNPARIKEACDRAIETESLAKERLNQLNYDLNIHCRIPELLQPRVVFADCIQHKTIPALDPSSAEKNS